MSVNWAGYAVESKISSPTSSTKGSRVVPSVTCDSTNTYCSVWVRTDDTPTEHGSEQYRTEQDCRNGSPTYYARYEIYPQLSRTAAEIPVMPGDIITAS